MSNSPSHIDDGRSSRTDAAADETPLTRRTTLGIIGVAASGAFAGCTADDGGTDTADDSDDSPTADDSGQVDDEPIDDADDADEAESTAYGDVVSFASAYEFVVEPLDRDAEISGRFDGENLYWRMEDDSDLFEMYYIGTDIYFVEDEQECMLMSSDQEMPQAEPIDPDTTDPQYLAGVEATMTHVGTDTIDGDPVDVYEHDDVEGSMYLHSDSGLPRRFQGDDAIVDWFYDDISPVEAPNLECEELPDF